MTESYRDSHKAKGADYHELFTSDPHTSMLWRIEQSVLDRIIGKLRGAGVGDYLDFACGTGRILAHVSRFSRSTTGVDVSASMLEVARQGVPDAELICGDLTRDDLLGERRFDLITAFRFFPNAEDELRCSALGALADHLEPEGSLVFNNHIHAGSLAIRLAKLRGRTSPDPTTRTLSRDDAAALVAGAGLRIVREYPIGSLPLSSRHMLRPVALVEAVERLLSRIPATRSIAQDILYVCQKA